MRPSKTPHTSDLFADSYQQPSPKPDAALSARPAPRSDAAPGAAGAVRPLTLPDERFLTDKDVAARYEVSRATVWRWTNVYPEFPKPHPVQTRRPYHLALRLTKKGTRSYGASNRDLDACALQLDAALIPRPTRSRATSTRRSRSGPRLADAVAGTSANERSSHRRKKVEMLLARVRRILRLGRLRLRGPSGARSEFLFAATAKNL